MAKYEVIQKLGTVNRPRMVHIAKEGRARPDDFLKPEGLVCHSTDTQGATDENEVAFEEGHPEAQSSAHRFIDWDSITQYIPENEIAWHAGTTANHKYLSQELCEPKDDDPDRFRKFQEVWNRGVWSAAEQCVRHGWSTGPNVFSHNGISQMYKETTHTDPYGFFKKYGKTWDDFIKAVDAEIIELKKPEAPQPIQEAPKTMNYENEPVRIIVDGKQAITLTGYTKSLGYAKFYYKGRRVVLQCKTDLHEWDLGVLPADPVVKDTPTKVQTPVVEQPPTTVTQEPVMPSPSEADYSTIGKLLFSIIDYIVKLFKK